MKRARLLNNTFNKEDDNFLEQIIDNKEGWFFMLTCLNGYLEYRVQGIRGGLENEK